MFSIHCASESGIRITLCFFVSEICVNELNPFDFQDDNNGIGTLSAAKFVQQFQAQHLENQLNDALNRREFACKRCQRPVRNNVFMEKTVDDCDAQEIKVEVDRLICCLHFLAEEFNVYQTLSGYLKATAKASRASAPETAQFASPYEFVTSPRGGTHRSHFNQSTGSVVEQLAGFDPDYQPSFHHTKTTTAMRIQKLHKAFIDEQSQRRFVSCEMLTWCGVVS